MAIIPPTISTKGSALSINQEEKQGGFVPFLFLFLLVVVTIFYVGFKLKQETSVQQALETSATKPTILSLKDIKFDVAFLQDEKVKALRIFLELPLKIENAGKVNPFSSL